MPTNQPTWEFVANLGDAHPVQYGGLFVFRDTTGVYPEEMESLQVIDEGMEHESWVVYRAVLDRLAVDHDEWFSDKLADVASCYGLPVEQLREQFTSEDARVRAMAYASVGDYFGWENLDSYPLTFSKDSEVIERYKDLDGKEHVSIRGN